MCIFDKTPMTTSKRPHWSPVACALRDPLLREIDTVRVQISRGTIRKLHDGTTVRLKSHHPRERGVNVVALHAEYATRLDNILSRIDHAMRTQGHWRTLNAPAEERLVIIAANEQAAGRPAGTLHWVQWEDPKIVKLMRYVFDNAGPHHPRKTGSYWMPYEPDGHRHRGAAAAAHKLKAWTDAWKLTLKSHVGWVGMTEGVPEECTDYWTRMHALNAKLPTPEMRVWIDDAIQTQLAAGRGPHNPRFTYSERKGYRGIWHSLDMSVRMALAAEYHDALVSARDHLIAAGKHDLARQVMARADRNIFALTDDEKKAITASPT
jgi:hypothetical protein